jgi:drug/metabolite transporter superfamily protein YnfA
MIRPGAVHATLLALVIAALLEIGGDAAVRAGLLQARWPLLVLGAVALVAYGLVVNLNRTIDFGRLMGVYIAVFFVVSQVISVVAFGERPPLRVLLAGALIVAGGLWIQLGAD